MGLHDASFPLWILVCQIKPAPWRKTACMSTKARNYKLVLSEKMLTGIIIGHFAALSC